MKEKYEVPEMEIIKFEEDDIIATSGEMMDPETGSTPEWWWGPN